MKTINLLLGSGFLFTSCFTSCESTKNTDLVDSEFRLVFSDGTEITERDIQFYDSTTHFLFLKNKLEFNPSVARFSVLVNNDTIYEGIKHSCFLSSPPPVAFFITDCFQYGFDIIDFGYYSYTKDLRNNPRIINALKTGNLLRNGLTCTIDSLKVKNLENSAKVYCRITITNHDRFNYYIPDPDKMGENVFGYYTGGMVFYSTENGTGSFLKWSEPNPDYGYLTIEDFSVLPGNSTISYSFESSDYFKLDKGVYAVRFRFCGLNNQIGNPAIIQKMGRIWIGEAVVEIDGFEVE